MATTCTLRLAALTAGLLLLSLGACADDTGDDDDDPTPGATDTLATYETQAFSIPFEIDTPPWSQTDVSIDAANFVTWDSAVPEQPALRFLLPVAVYPPGERTASPPPDDYLDYLLSQEEHGASFDDIAETGVGGKLATLVTATTVESLEGSLGCPAAELRAADCFGLQHDLTLRIAVIEFGDRSLVAWLRHDGSPETELAAQHFAEFEQLLQSIRFRDDVPAVTATATASADGGETSPLVGTWTTSFSKEQLATSPLLYDPEEVNDENWGDFVLTFERGEFTLEQENPVAALTIRGTFTTNGDVLSLVLENLEHFEMRFSVTDDTLTFERDDSLGIAPTPFVLRPWTR